MYIYPEIKKIAAALRKVSRLAVILNEKMIVQGINFKDCYLVDDCTEENGCLYKYGCRIDSSGFIDEMYYYRLYEGGDMGHYGTMYFKTNVTGQFLAVPFLLYGE